MLQKETCFSAVFLSALQGYLTESGFVNLQRVQMIMLAVGEVEDSIFKKRKDDDVNCYILGVWFNHVLLSDCDTPLTEQAQKKPQTL